MYLNGTLNINPSQKTNIQRKKPSKLFAKFFHVISKGLSSPKEERETFGAVSILQDLNRVFRQMGINNVVRLARDDMDFYFDEKGKKDDLKEAYRDFNLNTDTYASELFENIYLVLEHECDDLYYLIEINIVRRHAVGEYPIKMTFNASPQVLAKNDDESNKAYKERLCTRYQKQDVLDALNRQCKAKFEQFLTELTLNIRKYIQVDAIEVTQQLNVIRPKCKIDGYEDVIHVEKGAPLYRGYHGSSAHFFSAWIWADLLFENDLHVQDTTIVNESGVALFDVGSEGFQATDNHSLDTSESFEVPQGTDIDVLDASAVDHMSSYEGGSFFDFSSPSGSSDAEFDDIGSSCSSCSSCS